MSHVCIPVMKACCLAALSLGILLIHPDRALSQAPLFLPAVTYDGGGYLYSVAVGDLNGDGKPDIVAANGSGVSVLLGNGDGTFQAAAKYESGGSSDWVVIADVNDDRKPDLIVVNSDGGKNGDGSVGILLGKGDGTFWPAVINDSGGQGATSLSVSDINSDGIPDLIVANGCFGNNCTSGPWVGTLIGNGDGTFQSVVTYANGGLMPMDVMLADLNGDRKLDMLLANYYPYSSAPQSVGVRLGNGDGTFGSEAFYGTSSTNGASSITAADVNLDGKLDLVVANYWGGISVLLGIGDGTFQPAADYQSGTSELGGPSLVVADVNGDGKPDLLVANYAGYCPSTSLYDCGGAVDLLLGNGDGTFQPVASYSSAGYGAQSVAVADLIGNGKLDVVVANARSSGFGGIGTIAVLLNNTPFCTTAPNVTVSATPGSLWPPNGGMVPVTFSGTITNTQTGCSIQNAAYVVKDEYNKVQPGGSLTLGPGGAFSLIVPLQASRLGSDLDGRQYTITVGASNNVGKTGSQSVRVIVPHDQRR